MKWIKRCSVLFLVLFSFWLAVSFLDINAHNMSNRRYAPWNTGGGSQPEKPAAAYPIERPKMDETSKPRVTPQATQIPSARGVTNKKIYRLAQLMYAENGSAESDDCVLLTGIVVVKRMMSDKYPNTLEGVISQEGQYSTYQTGKIECEPDERCLEIAEEILRFDLQKYYPDNLVYQAEFPQGSKTYEQFGHEYFCLE